MVAGALIEEVLVPIPSPLVPMAAGVILIETSSFLPAMVQILLIIAIPASLASAVSSYFVYSIAYFGGEPLIQRYGMYLDLSWDEVKAMESHFGTEREKYLVMGLRMVPLVPLSLVSGAAGLFRMDWRRYGIWTFIGMMPRNFFLALAGWYVRDDFIALASSIDKASTAVTILAVSVFVLWILEKKFRRLYRSYLLS